MNCDQVQKELLEGLEGRQPVREAVREHLDQCGECTEFRSTLELVVPEDMPAPSSVLDERVLDIAAQKCRERQCGNAPINRRFRLISFRTVRWAAAAAAAIVLVVASYEMLFKDRAAPKQARGGPAAGSNGDTRALYTEALDSLQTEMLAFEAQLAALSMMDASTKHADTAPASQSGDNPDTEAFLELEAHLLYLEETI